MAEFFTLEKLPNTDKKVRVVWDTTEYDWNELDVDNYIYEYRGIYGIGEDGTNWIKTVTVNVNNEDDWDDAGDTELTSSIPNEEDKVYESPSKSSKHACLDDAERRNTPISRTPPSDKKGSANKKQFNYRANRKHVMAPTRLDLVDQAPSSPIGDLRKPRRRHSLKRSIKKGMQANPVVATTVALSAVLFFLRFA